MREALLRPKVVGEFLRSYDGAALPSEAIAKNVLIERGVPSERLDSVLALIVESAEDVGFIRQIGAKRYVDLASPVPTNEAGELPQQMPTIPVALAQTVAPAAPAAVSVGAGIHINIEIHIAADATSDTIEEIFKNMRRYVLTSDGQSDDDAANAE
jgi:hypothetical protein